MQKILYVHIPKAGGSAVNAYFAERIGEKKCYPHAENRLSDKDADHSKVDRCRYVSAHLIYPRLRRHFADQNRFGMTVLRNPMDQLTSHLAWVRYQTDARQKRAYEALPDFLKELAQRMTKIDLGNPVSLEKFLEELEPRELAFFDNCQTRYLVPYMAGPAGPGMLARAKRNLQALDFVGICERMQDVFDYLSWHFRLLPAEGSMRVNVTQQRYGLDPADPALRKVLQPYIALDEELYDEARRLFGARIHEMWTELSRANKAIINRDAVRKQLRGNSESPRR